MPGKGRLYFSFPVRGRAEGLGPGILSGEEGPQRADLMEDRPPFPGLRACPPGESARRRVGAAQGAAGGPRQTGFLSSFLDGPLLNRDNREA